MTVIINKTNYVEVMKMGAIYKSYGCLNKNSLMDRLYNLSFDSAQKMIDKMPDDVRAIILKEIDETKLELNTQMCLIDVYTTEDGYPRALCSMGEYMFMQSMVKRLDILVSMLCSVNEALEEFDAYEQYREYKKLQSMTPQERIAWIDMMKYEGKNIPDRETITAEMNASAGNIESMHQLCQNKTMTKKHVKGDEMLQQQAADLAKRYFNRKLKIDMGGK